VLGAEAPPLALFFAAASADEKQAKAALERLAEGWQEGYAGMIVDIARFLRGPRFLRTDTGGGDEDEIEEQSEDPFAGRFDSPPVHAAEPASPVRQRLLRFLERQTGQSFGQDLAKWRQWVWSRTYSPHPDYATFKAALYGRVDPAMAAFFPAGVKSLIRLDEVDWGGVRVDGIAPLDHPKVVQAGDAGYLKDGHIVFGLSVNGEARAYPKRILAWHEVARDRLGGVELTVVYCVLCGTVIPYESEVGGRARTFGTSGLLYRSNKLLFDAESLSLWSTLEGRPVIGSLAGSGLELVARPVVTTTWGEWRAAHPETTVLSLDTGHRRDYGEGVAYRDYLHGDRLMFGVPGRDERLRNKAEVLALRLRPRGAPPSAPRRALAVSVDFLRKRPLHSLEFAGHRLLVVTSPGGANRVYAAGDVGFARVLGPDILEDAQGRRWKLGEASLSLEGGGASPLPRVAAARAFWFGWRAQFPETELVD
jgi:hypothetical protein